MCKYQINKRSNLKDKCLNYLGGKKCLDCGINHLPPICYDFHHKVGGKDLNISQMLNGKYSWSELKKELDKCIILCANCHRLRHRNI